MTEIRCRDLLDADEPTVLITLRHPDPYLTEVVGHAGYDGVIIDLQHGAIDYDAAYFMLVALASSASTVLVRLPGHDPALAMKMLDAGAQGIVCPGLASAEDTASFVGACRYPLDGYRSLGPNRVGLTPGYLDAANDTILTVAAVDTAAAREALAATAATPDLDAVLLEGDAVADPDAYAAAAAAGRPVLVAVDPTDDVRPAGAYAGGVIGDHDVYRRALAETLDGVRAAAQAAGAPA